MARYKTASVQGKLFRADKHRLEEVGFFFVCVFCLFFVLSAAFHLGPEMSLKILNWFE